LASVSVPSASANSPSEGFSRPGSAPLRRVLNFTGHSIDEVVNNPLVKHKVLAYFKLHKFVERRSDVVDLERQWNPLGS